MNARSLATKFALLALVAMLAMVTLPTGAAQATSGVALDCPRHDIAIILDKQNTALPTLQAIRGEIDTFMDTLDADDMTALWSVLPAGTDKTSITSDHDATKSAAQAPGGANGGSLRSVMIEATDHLDFAGRLSAHQMIIVISDGQWNSALDVAQPWRDENQYRNIVSIALGNTPHAQMESMATSNDEPFYFEAATDGEITAAFADIATMIAECGIPNAKVQRVIGACLPNPIPFIATFSTSDLVNVTAISWFWGDGESDEKLPANATYMEHVYPGFGLYTIRLELHEGDRFTYGQDFKISAPRCAPQAPRANFSCGATPGPDTKVTFTDQSEEALYPIVKHTWDLGDGTIINDVESFTHTYQADAGYWVNLTIEDSDGQTSTTGRICFTLQNEAPVIEDVTSNHESDFDALNNTLTTLVREGDVLRLTLFAADPDGDNLDYCWEQPESNGIPSYGLEITPPTLRWQTSHGHAGKYGPLTACVDDGQVRAERKVYVIVLAGTTDHTEDGDGDGINDLADNCPHVRNVKQIDADDDGIGDACDDNVAKPPTSDDPSQFAPNEGDQDRDGYQDDVDNCPTRSNVDQKDADADGYGDACDDDVDGDGIVEGDPLLVPFADNCPGIPNPQQQDADNDGIGDMCDTDSSNDDAASQSANEDNKLKTLDEADTANVDAAPSGISGPAIGLLAMLGSGIVVAGVVVLIVQRRA